MIISRACMAATATFIYGNRHTLAMHGSTAHVYCPVRAALNSVSYETGKCRFDGGNARTLSDLERRHLDSARDQIAELEVRWSQRRISEQYALAQVAGLKHGLRRVFNHILAQ